MFVVSRAAGRLGRPHGGGAAAVRAALQHLGRQTQTRALPRVRHRKGRIQSCLSLQLPTAELQSTSLCLGGLPQPDVVVPAGPPHQGRPA